MGSQNYVKEAVRNVENWLDQKGRSLKTKASSVLPSGYVPELDVSESLHGVESIGYYQQQIGILRWCVELGRIDICTEASMMAAYSAAPRIGHLEAVMHIYAYLKSHSRSRLVFDSSYNRDVPPPEKFDWSQSYGDAKERILMGCLNREVNQSNS